MLVLASEATGKIIQVAANASYIELGIDICGVLKCVKKLVITYQKLVIYKAEKYAETYFGAAENMIKEPAQYREA